MEERFFLVSTTTRHAWEISSDYPENLKNGIFRINNSMVE